MINNFELIKSLLKFEDKDEFYFIQILQRSKENPGLGKNNRLVKAYYIYTLEYLERKTEEMILLANSLNARIYIHLNRRNSRMISLELMEDLAHCIKSNEIYNLDKLYNSCCGRHHSDKDKTWVVDIDSKDDVYINNLIDNINKIELIDNKYKIIVKIPTKNGIHLITRPFNSKDFSFIYPDIEIHKNNPTILYVP